MLYDTQDLSGNWKKQHMVNGVKCFTKSGQVWYDMRKRCTPGSAVQKARPSYVGCTLSANFANFNFFASWYTAQIGYLSVGFEIDKDLLIQGNQLYSEDTCVLIPKALNNFLIADRSNVGECPTGITKTISGTYRVCVSVGSRRKELGCYATLDQASTAYRVAKEAEARRWYHRLVAGEYIVDPRVVERMRVWTPV